MSNTFTKFIDSCVGAIARKVQDEFDESKHPRDKGGRFSSKGGEGRGAGTSEYDGMDRDEMEQLRSEAMRKQEREKAGSDKFHEYQKQISELTKLINRAKNSEEDDDEGYMGLSKEELAEEEEYENARERARREKDDDRVTGPEDRDYMNEEDDDEDSTSEESESGVEDIQKSLRRNVASSVEDLLEDTKDDGYDAELVSDEFMIVRKDDKEYRAHIDRAGSSYYVDKVEEW